MSNQEPPVHPEPEKTPLKVGTPSFRNISDIEKVMSEWHKMEMKDMCHDIVNWLNRALGPNSSHRVKHDDEAELCDQLRDGVILCALVERFFPKARGIPTIHKHAIGGKTSTFAYIENITFFLNFLKERCGFPEDLCFEADDLYSYDDETTDKAVKRNILLTLSMFAAFLHDQGALQREVDYHKDLFVANPGDQLHFAMANKDKEKVQKILSEHKNAHELKSTHGWTSLYSAAWYDLPWIIEALFEHGATNKPLKDGGWYPLHAAAYTGALSAIEELLKHKDLVKVNVYNDEGLSPLFYAVTADHGHATKTLLHAKADPHGAKDDGMTPVHGAVHRGRVSRLRQLVKAGADINVRFHKKSYTPLHLAVVDELRHDEPSMVGAVLHYKADVNAVTAPGNTALMLAAIHGLNHAAKKLIEAGADMKVKNHSKHDALALAVRNGHTHVGELIAKALGVDLPDLPEHHTVTHDVAEPDAPPAPTKV
mmetsp:Transcript_22477/g.38064  ORF Transcript_22477/g.38064 Transcript_22477/m.38064 type:complete len:482 (+) Transcript_22477:133-1578(+)